MKPEEELEYLRKQLQQVRSEAEKERSKWHFIAWWLFAAAVFAWLHLIFGPSCPGL